MFTCKPASSLGQEENQPGHDSLCSSVTYLWGSGKPTAFLWTLVSSSLKWEVTLIPFRAVIKSDWRGGGACQPLSPCPHPVVPLETQEVKGYHDSVFYLLILLETKYLENPFHFGGLCFLWCVLFKKQKTSWLSTCLVCMEPWVWSTTYTKRQGCLRD